MIKVKNLSLDYGDMNFFDDLSFEIPKDKISIIVGPNGVGKTTLIKVLAGIIKPKTIDIKSNSTEVFYLPQKIRYVKGITLYEYVSSIFFKQNWKWYLDRNEKTTILNVLFELELTDKRNVLIENLSTGELQKANIAMGLISGANLLLLDEPTSNMDLINQIKVLNIIRKLTTRNITSVVILHDLNLSSSYGDYFLGLNAKKELCCGVKEEFFTEEKLKDIYNMQFKVINNDENIHVQIFN